jgi:hypothetical protein
MVSLCCSKTCFHSVACCPRQAHYRGSDGEMGIQRRGEMSFLS